MFEPCPLGLGGGRRSDRHGVIERHPTLALSRSFLDPGDIAAHRAVEEHGPQIPALGQRRAEVQHPGPAEQAGPLRRQAVADAAAGGGEVAQAEADDQAVARRSGRRSATTAPTIAWRPSPATGRPPGSESRRPPAAASSCRWRSCPARRSSSTGPRTGRSSRGERTKLQVAHFKLSLQPRLHSPRLSAADPRDAVRRP